MNATRADYIVVGTGATGATIARTLADAGRSVLLIDRRNAIGGNVHDFLHPSGIRIHTYGPHYFRTNSERIWDFVNRFAEFRPYKAIVQSLVDGRHESWPVNDSYLRTLPAGAMNISGVENPASFEEACLGMMPLVVYEKFVKEYTQKQWGTSPRLLSKDLAGRFEVRRDDDPHFSRHRYQGIPRPGYARFMEAMTDGIPRVLDVDFLQHRAEFVPRKLLIYTGAIDEFFGFDLGRLRYRAQRREHHFHEHERWVQPVGQVNNPALANGDYVRSLEWKHMMADDERDAIEGTVVTREYPYSPSDPDAYEYPFPDDANSMLYAAYRKKADAIRDTLICGRLGEYKYYDMDQAIARALMLARQILEA